MCGKNRNWRPFASADRAPFCLSKIKVIQNLTAVKKCIIDQKFATAESGQCLITQQKLVVCKLPKMMKGVYYNLRVTEGSLRNSLGSGDL